MSVCSGSVIHADGAAASGASKRQSSTRAAWAEKIAKFAPRPVHVAPSGYGWPGQTRMSTLSGTTICADALYWGQTPSDEATQRCEKFTHRYSRGKLRP